MFLFIYFLLKSARLHFTITLYTYLY